MRRASFADMPCSVARTLEVVGEWWSLLVVRDCLLGVSRFDHLRERLGIARNVLSDRLDTLVAHGVLERRPYQDHPPRYDYLLTDKGRDLWPVVVALREWGDRWAGWDPAPPLELVHRPCGHATQVVPTCARCRGVLHLDDLASRPAPGAAHHVLPERR